MQKLAAVDLAPAGMGLCKVPHITRNSGLYSWVQQHRPGVLFFSLEARQRSIAVHLEKIGEKMFCKFTNSHSLASDSVVHNPTSIRCYWQRGLS